ncbi:hypothetical protein SDC9_61223 [bioreactor metagenome]|uniref:DUF1684 domain-containing protein n=1 Tax=bioreactor metagenome TaxID=1076179 RepID=A0A644XFJ9_9ZZZZ
MKQAFLLLSFSFCLLSFSSAQTDSAWYQSVIVWQQEMNKEYADSATSPLTPEDRAVFKGLPFYAPNADFCVQAILELTPDAEPFIMKTSGVRTPTYRQYGVFNFEIKGQAFVLPAYQRVEVLTTDEYADYLFIPFNDQTNGESTYISGRYLDLQIQKDSVYILDFNKAYNPYCAYNHKYSCPIPPKENFLDIRIEAGVIDNK